MSREAGPTGRGDLWVVRVRERPGWDALLPRDEHDSAMHRRTPTGRAESLTAAGLLRLAVGRCTGVGPADLTIRRTCRRCEGEGHGRPRLVGRCPGGGSWPDVSVAHAAGVVVVAVVPDGRVGIDVEALDRPAVPARLVCGDAELAALESLSPRALRTALLRTWVRKEAVLKLAGTGLSGPWTALDVRSGVVLPPAVIWPGPVRLRDVRGLGRVLTGSPAVVAALATTAPVRRLHLHGEDDLPRG